MTTPNTSNRRHAAVWLVFREDRISTGARILRQINKSTTISELAIVWNGTKTIPEDLVRFKLDNLTPRVIIGSNRGREFGGYQEGMDSLDLSAVSGVYFINDTAGVHNYIPSYFISAFTKDIDRDRGDAALCFGHIDHTKSSFTLQGMVCKKWVRSNLFYLNSSAINLVSKTIYSPDIDDLIHPDIGEKFFSPFVEEALRSRIKSWLFTPSRNSWYGASPLTLDNSDFMAGKARSILHEYYLSLRIIANGGALVAPSMGKLFFFFFKAANRFGRIFGILR